MVRVLSIPFKRLPVDPSGSPVAFGTPLAPPAAVSPLIPTTYDDFKILLKNTPKS